MQFTNKARGLCAILALPVFTKQRSCKGLSFTPEVELANREAYRFPGGTPLVRLLSQSIPAGLRPTQHVPGSIPEMPSLRLPEPCPRSPQASQSVRPPFS